MDNTVLDYESEELDEREAQTDEVPANNNFGGWPPPCGPYDGYNGRNDGEYWGSVGGSGKRFLLFVVGLALFLVFCAIRACSPP